MTYVDQEGPAPPQMAMAVVQDTTQHAVIYAKKDFNLPAHPDIPGVPNLQVREGYMTYLRPVG